MQNSLVIYMSTDFQNLANAIRVLAMDAVEQARSGHPGMPMGMADVATVLFTKHLNFDPQDPHWHDRDRFVLSAGHGSMLLYSLLYLSGYEDMTIEQLQNFRQLGAKTAGHPEYGHAGGIETTTGPLGQGLANAAGMALAERHLNAEFGDDLVKHYTYAIAGDGCLMEGISHEAASLAGHLQLGRLIVLYDDNQISIDGSTDLTLSDDARQRFEAYGWHTLAVDGHDHDAIDAALLEAQRDPRPSLVACKTKIGYGAPNMQGSAKTHGSPLGSDEIAATRDELGWSAPPFEVPEDILAQWRHLGARGAVTRSAWRVRLDQHQRRAEFEQRLATLAISDCEAPDNAYCNELAQQQLKVATRAASEKCLEHLVAQYPALLGGSADLTGSNNTKTKTMAVLDASNYGGRYIHYGVREHAMAAMMNGMALHGGVVPYAGTFLAFSDYSRPAIRLAALMQIRVVHVMTHDSIGLGEDGPTHQPVEQIAALRAIPNLLVLRPADTVETMECWQIALAQSKQPSVLALTRQALAPVRTEPSAINKCAQGAYVLHEPQSARAVTLIASGSEVNIAVAAARQLEQQGIAAAVVSMPSFELLRAQKPAYRDAVLGSAPRVAVEAAVRQGWDEWLRKKDAFVGMASFGASAPAAQLYQHFGITAEAVAQVAREVIENSAGAECQ